MNIRDALTAYQLDAAVSTFGVIVENALMETVETGSGPHKTRRPRYTLQQILEDTFKLSRKQDEEWQGTLAVIKSASGGFYDEVS